MTPGTDHVNTEIELGIITFAFQIFASRSIVQSQVCQFDQRMRSFQIFNGIQRGLALLTSFIIFESCHLTSARHFSTEPTTVQAFILPSRRHYYQNRLVSILNSL